MRFKHEIIGLETTNDIFRRFDAVSTHDGVLTQQRANVLRCTLASSTHDHEALLCDRDRDGIGSYLRTTTPPPDGSLFEVNHGPFEEGMCSLQEVPRIALCLEPDDVIANPTTLGRLHDVDLQYEPVTHIVSRSVD